uniref:RNA-directed DNA polymerase, eukaryota n=1 Tax=Tanacetum cinerariifolium TaxID=118510 RepID=A0A699J8G9_TANCI|nr:RNA-directed DNA polymerase, eukaryota [Tanacetum cinerariifolium]
MSSLSLYSSLLNRELRNRGRFFIGFLSRSSKCWNAANLIESGFLAQFERFKEMVEGVTLSNSNDRWSWSLVGSGDFSVSSVRKLIDNAILSKGISKTRWIKEMISDAMRKIIRWWDLEYREINSFEDWCQWISSIRLLIFDQEDPSTVNVYDEMVYRSFYWIRFQDIALCKAWCDVSENKANTLNFKGFWSEVLACFEKETGKKIRRYDVVVLKWKKSLRPKIAAFIAVYERVK